MFIKDQTFIRHSHKETEGSLQKTTLTDKNSELECMTIIMVQKKNLWSQKNKHPQEKSYMGRICKQEIDGKPEEKKGSGWEESEEDAPYRIMKKENEEMLSDLVSKLLSCFFNNVRAYFINYGGK